MEKVLFLEEQIALRQEGLDKFNEKKLEVVDLQNQIVELEFKIKGIEEEMKDFNEEVVLGEIGALKEILADITKPVEAPVVEVAEELPPVEAEDVEEKVEENIFSNYTNI